MSAHQLADGRQNVMRVEVIRTSHDRRPGSGELENYESRSGLENPVNFAQTCIQIGDIANPERDNRPRHRRGSNWEVQRICCNGIDAMVTNLRNARAKHWLGEVSSEYRSTKPFASRYCCAYVECTGAKIQIPAGGVSRYIELADGFGSPRAIDVEAENMIQEIVARSNLGKKLLHVGALFFAAFSGSCRNSLFVLVSHGRES